MDWDSASQIEVDTFESTKKIVFRKKGRKEATKLRSGFSLNIFKCGVQWWGDSLHFVCSVESKSRFV